MSIKYVRDRLIEKGKEVGDPELIDLANQTYRRPAVRRASKRSPKVDKNMAQEIRDYADEHPDLHLQDIAETFGVNPGRVSEALNHLR